MLAAQPARFMRSPDARRATTPRHVLVAPLVHSKATACLRENDEFDLGANVKRILGVLCFIVGAILAPKDPTSTRNSQHLAPASGVLGVAPFTKDE